MSFEISVPIQVKKEIKVNISNEMEKFCQLYANNFDFAGDPYKCYLECYELEPHEEGKSQLVKAKAKELLQKPEIMARISQLLAENGFNDANVDKQHLFILNQYADLNVKMKGIEHYNKLKKRTNDSPVIVMPTPIMDWDDAEPKQLDKEDVKVIKPDALQQDNSN